jgi:protein-S-isoprenylcysteine O-methyltransferase Ste14
MMISLGGGIFPALEVVARRPGPAIPVRRAAGLICLIVSGIATLLTVLNPALRDLGAPIAAKPSSRPAADRMYGWTRNPMLLATLSMLAPAGLRYRSLWFLA